MTSLGQIRLPFKFRFKKGDKSLLIRQGHGFNGGIDEPWESDYKYTFDVVECYLYWWVISFEYNIKQHD